MDGARPVMARANNGGAKVTVKELSRETNYGCLD